MVYKDHRNILVISTCGISILLNSGETPEQKSFLLNHTSKKTDELDKSAKNKIASIARLAASKLASAPGKAEISKLSAELNSIQALHESLKVFDRKVSVEHVLITSDSHIATESSKLLKSWIDGLGFKCDVKSFALSISSLQDFHAGLDDVVQYLSALLPDGIRESYKIIFNLTGGFKGLQGHMQVLGMLWADEIVYIFERSNELMRIPRLPVSINFRDIIIKNLTIFRKLEIGLKPDEQELKMLGDGILIDLGGDYMLSTYAKAEWSKSQKELLSEELLVPLSKRLSFKNSVKQQINDLDKDKILQINQRFDRFSKYLEDQGELLSSDGFKKIKGKARPGMTHELYAWSDGQAKRFYGKYNNDVFEIHELGSHL